MSELAAELVAALVDRGQTVATAESITAGGVCAMLTTVAGASAVVRGGLIVYSADLKVSLAGVPRDLLDAEGEVTESVALLLADAARERCGADWGIGLTGVAGPGPANGVPAGTVYIGVSGPSGRFARLVRLSGGRDAVRTAAVERAMGFLREHLAAVTR